ncbi:MAG: SDR family NAD(P)-dependent oxidoreductase [Solirubrobacterales bacterium]
MDLSGLTAMVTGANRGMGLAFAQRLAAEPLERLIVTTRSPDEYPVFELPPGGAKELSVVRLDLGSQQAIEESVASWGPEADRIDVLLNNAGLLTAGLLEDQEVDGIYAMLQANLVGLMHLTRLVVPQMIERGRGLVVNNASISGYAYLPATSTYAASKAGVVAFSESLRRELRPTGVSVMHLVTPRVETDMAEEMDDTYEGHVDTKSFESTEPDAWAEKVVQGILDGDHIVGPGGRTAVSKLLSRGPAGLLDKVSDRIFSRERG